MAPMIERSNEFGSLSETRLAEFEKRLGYQLPEGYRAFLLAHNGGRPDPGSFNLEYWGEATVDIFFGLHEGPYYARLEPAYDNWAEFLSPGSLPIGCDTAGDVICISLAGEKCGSIFLGELHARLDGDYPLDKYIFDWLATSFQDFLDMLVPETPE